MKKSSGPLLINIERAFDTLWYDGIMFDYVNTELITIISTFYNLP